MQIFFNCMEFKKSSIKHKIADLEESFCHCRFFGRFFDDDVQWRVSVRVQQRQISARRHQQFDALCVPAPRAQVQDALAVSIRLVDVEALLRSMEHLLAEWKLIRSAKTFA